MRKRDEESRISEELTRGEKRFTGKAHLANELKKAIALKNQSKRVILKTTFASTTLTAEPVNERSKSAGPPNKTYFGSTLEEKDFELSQTEISLSSSFMVTGKSLPPKILNTQEPQTIADWDQQQ
jgi:hypothetical protein